jgi:SAM-dependent methyltransferase
MQRKAFQLLHDAESSWWYQGRMLVVARVLAHFLNTKTNYHIADVGAGYGGMLSLLKSYGNVTAYEPDEEAQQACAKRGYDNVATLFGHTLNEALPQNTYSLIAAFDVLEHAEDDRAFLSMLHGALRSDGGFIMTVPAYPFLFGPHDIEHHHYRRYTRDALTRLLETSGFTVRYASYWNMFLFIPAALMRLSGRTGAGSLTMAQWIDRLFFGIVRTESAMMPTFRLPFGTGIVCYAEKR